MRCVGRLVLAAQPQRDDAGEPADDQAGGIDHHPLLFDVGGFGRKGIHDCIPGIGAGIKARLIHEAPRHRQCCLGHDPQFHQKLVVVVL